MLVYRPRARGTSGLSGGSEGGAQATAGPVLTQLALSLQAGEQPVASGRHCAAPLLSTQELPGAHVPPQGSKTGRASRTIRSQSAAVVGFAVRLRATFTPVARPGWPARFALCARYVTK